VLGDKMLMHEALEKCGLRWPKMGKLTCPKHPDKTPSLQLYKDSFYCFSCQITGDAYGFIALWKNQDIADVLRQWAPKDGQDAIMRVHRQTVLAVGPEALDKRQRRLWQDMNAYLFSRLHIVFHDLSTQILVDEIERMADQFGDLAERVEGMTGFQYDTALREFKQEQGAYLDRADARLNGWQLGALRDKYAPDGTLSRPDGRDTNGGPG